MGIRAYFESKIGVTVRFVPSLCAKITLKKGRISTFSSFQAERLKKKWSAFCLRHASVALKTLFKLSADVETHTLEPYIMICFIMALQ